MDVSYCDTMPAHKMIGKQIPVCCFESFNVQCNLYCAKRTGLFSGCEQVCYVSTVGSRALITILLLLRLSNSFVK